jgi:hypothetical protein
MTESFASVFLIASLGCQLAPRDADVPWPHGMTELVTSEQPSPSATQRLHEYLPAVDEDCSAGAYHAIELVADVARPSGAETILASYANGMVVLDREGRVLASRNGYRCEGSSDELEGLAVGRAYRDPTIVVIARTGGRRESTTFAALFRLGRGKRLDPVFTGTIELQAGDDVSRGAIYMLPNALVYRLPDGRHAFYVFDPVGRVYLDPRDPLDDPGHEPPLDEVPASTSPNT